MDCWYSILFCSIRCWNLFVHRRILFVHMFVSIYVWNWYWDGTPSEVVRFLKCRRRLPTSLRPRSSRLSTPRRWTPTTTSRYIMFHSTHIARQCLEIRLYMMHFMSHASSVVAVWRPHSVWWFWQVQVWGEWRGRGGSWEQILLSPDSSLPSTAGFVLCIPNLTDTVHLKLVLQGDEWWMTDGGSSRLPKCLQSVGKFSSSWA